jgi:outer membrane protein OmpA-like peptidoglycan-associated protein
MSFFVSSARKLVFAVILFTAAGVAVAQVQVQGLITGRSGATMTLQTPDSPNTVVLLTDYTQVEEVEGVFHARKKQMAITALVPGLSVQVQGSPNAQNQLVAATVRFKGSDLKTAQDIQAGLQPTEQQVQANQQQEAATKLLAQQNQARTLANQQKVQQQEQALQQQEQALKQQQQQLAAEQQKIAANKAAIAAANKRFGELADYNILGETEVLFANGQVTVDPQYQPALLQLAEKAMTITGYVIQVKGYASKVGSAALNQKLSMERADNVLTFLEQQGKVPLTNVLAPGAMGTSQQVAPDSSVEGQAENRRVVVRILQNKGIAGT